MRLVMMGAPGAGKGTQAKLLEERYEARQVSTGDILRAATHKESPLGLAAKSAMEQGRLVPDQVVIGIVAERMAAPDLARGFVLDGFPRTVRQAKALDALLQRLGQPLDAVVFIDVPRDELVVRLAGRRVCRQCGAMAHVVFDPPRQPDVCNRCGGELFQRDDDRETVIAKRLDVYGRETAPVLEHYRGTGLLHEVQGTGTREDVFSRVLASVQ